MKAYLGKNRITLVSSAGEEASFIIGSGVIDCKNSGAYKMLKGSVKADVILDKLYATYETPKDMLSFLCGKEFAVSMENFGGEILPAFEVKTKEDLFLLELTAAFSSDRPLKKCEHCGKYFIPTGRTDAVYCDRVGEDGYSCKKIGAHRQYRKQSRENDVKAMYDKITKHNRYLKNCGKISERDYDRWMSSVSESYAAFKAGSISERSLMTELYKEIGSRRNASSISDYLL